MRQRVYDRVFTSNQPNVMTSTTNATMMTQKMNESTTTMSATIDDDSYNNDANNSGEEDNAMATMTILWVMLTTQRRL